VESQERRDAVDVTKTPQFLLLQSLITIVLSYQILFSQDPALSFEGRELIILGLVVVLGLVWKCPPRLWDQTWFVALFVSGDTAITSAIIYLTGNARTELFLTYFVIILLAACTANLNQHIGLSVILCVVYGIILYLGVGQVGSMTEGQFLQIPVLLIMAIFYGACVDMVRGERKEKTALQETIAALKRAEQALRESEEQLRQSQKMEAVGRLAGGIAHDFNNMLTVIQGFSQLLLGSLGPQTPAHGQVEEIHMAAQRAAALTQQLLAFSRKQPRKPRALDLNAVVAGMGAMLQRLLGEDIRLVTSPGSLPGHVWADPNQFEHVIINLVINARDAMPRGGTLTVATENVELDGSFTQTHPGPRPGSYVLLAVDDTGVGMNADTLAHCFEPFFTTKPKGQGTGLGLATVYGIVKQSDGEIYIASEPGQGTKVRVYLPRVEARSMAIVSAPPPAVLYRGAETVLLAEDELGVRKLVREVLEQAGHTVLEAASGPAALQAAKGYAGAIQLLLTDVVMPEMSGPELAKQLTTARPELKVLYMSGYTEEAILQHGMLSAGITLLQKPFSKDDLLRRVRDVMDSSP
jgi:signal transduction histidine kinase/ActR/RegA family two-component response regulator